MAGTGTAHLRAPERALLRLEELVVEHPGGRSGPVQAVSGISLDVLPGETVGLVGESGCGKSSLTRAVMQLPPPSSGRVLYDGRDLAALSREELRRTRFELRMIFQDSISSLNPRRRVRDIVAEPQTIWARRAKADRLQDVRAMLEVVGLDPELTLNRRPHQFSGGQCQRISIARALMMDPRLLICDEPVSSLDVSVQASILNLLEDMKGRYGLTLLFIAHDLVVVKSISDRVAVMYLGKLCEVGAPDELYRLPAHPYTRLLIESIPQAQRNSSPGSAPVGELPSPANPPSGCRFRTRCPFATARCAEEEPMLREVTPGRYVACHVDLAEADTRTIDPATAEGTGTWRGLR